MGWPAIPALAVGLGALAASLAWAPRRGARAIVLAAFVSLGAAARQSVRAGEAPEGRAVLHAEVRATEARPDGQRLWLRVTGLSPAPGPAPVPAPAPAPGPAAVPAPGPAPADFGALVTVPGFPEARTGDRILLPARLRAPEPALNPGAADARASLARRGIAMIGAGAPDSALVLEPGRTLAGAAESFRRRFAAWALDRTADPDRAALVVALSVGERAEIDQELSQAFNASGLAHLLSISGLHLAVAVLLAWRLLRAAWRRVPPLARRIESGRAAAAATLPLTALYVILAGAPAPAVRAGIGAGLFLAARILGREPDALNTLALAALAILAVEPGALFDPSFQLSFAAMLGLLVLAPRLRELVPLRKPEPGASGLARRGGEWLLGAALTTLAASLATAPIVAAVFQRASVWGLVANLIALPLGTALVPLGLTAAGLFALAPPLAGPVLDLSALVAGALNGAARIFGALPGAQLTVSAPSALALCAWYGALVAVIWLRRLPRAAAAGLAISVALLAGQSAWRAAAARLSTTLAVTFLAVGQGDAAVARLPGGRTLLVDAGGPASDGWDPGERIVVPFLAYTGASAVDLMLLSHPHPDHMDGLFAVIDRFPVAALWHNGRPPILGEPHPLVAHALARGVLVREVAQGESTDLGGATLTVLRPAAAHGEPSWGENDNSVVARLAYKSVSFLFPGDVEQEGEEGLAIQADVVKAPHHGSRTSSTEAFVRAAGAHHVVFCVGRENRYGHPAPEVVARWEGAGCRTWRTDRDGAVTFTTDGAALEVEPFVRH